MTTLTSYNKTDLVDDVLAADINKLIAVALRAEFTNTETITTTKQLTDNDCQFQVITASGANRTVELAPEATTNHITVVYNTSPTYSVLVKDDSGGTTFITLAPDEWAMFVPVKGETWMVLENRATLKKYFDTIYVAEPQPIMGHSGANQITAGQTRFFSIALMDATESNVYMVFPGPGTIKNLVVYSQGSPGVGQTYVCTLRKSLADTTITCTIVAGSNTSSDPSHTAAVAASDRWALKVVASAGAATTNISFAFEFVPD